MTYGGLWRDQRQGGRKAEEEKRNANRERSEMCTCWFWLRWSTLSIPTNSHIELLLWLKHKRVDEKTTRQTFVQWFSLWLSVTTFFFCLAASNWESHTTWNFKQLECIYSGCKLSFREQIHNPSVSTWCWAIFKKDPFVAFSGILRCSCVLQHPSTHPAVPNMKVKLPWPWNAQKCT